MKIVVFLNTLGLGGTEKAACLWAIGLQKRGHGVTVLTLQDGPRRARLESANVAVRIAANNAEDLASQLGTLSPDVIHAHTPGFPHVGDVLGDALAKQPRKIPVVQTNVFGRLENPAEDAWTDYRLFISWTSCVQAAQRAFLPLDETLFRRTSVAVYPVYPAEAPPAEAVKKFRHKLGVREDEMLFGRFSRPEPNKWTSLALDAFRLALRSNRKIKLLLREPPPNIAAALRTASDAAHFVVLPVTVDGEELHLTMAATDVVLHTSSIGESFGYGIAESMNLAKPVITHSVPWADQAQIELVRHGECGFVTSTPATMAQAIVQLANDDALRQRMGLTAQQYIRELANPNVSINRLEATLSNAIARLDNPAASEDLYMAKRAATYLSAEQFGHSLWEQIALRPFYYRAGFHQWRHRRLTHR